MNAMKLTLVREIFNFGKVGSRVSSQSGNAILFSLATAAAGMISALAITPMFQTARNQVVIHSSKSSFEAILQGSMDYTLAGVKNRWCFTTSMLQDANCSLTHVGNVERMIMSNDTVKFIKTFMTVNADYVGDVVLPEIVKEVSFGQINVSHPLYTLTQTLPPNSVTAIRFQITRINDINEPAKSREVILKVRISLIGTDTVNRMFSEAKIAVFPRELNTFSLILPNDLYIGAPSPANSYDSSLQGGAGPTTGLTFLSPVFVNGNLFLPTQVATSAATGVTFSDRIYLGGNLFADGGRFSPVTAGAPGDQTLNSLKNFGGLLGGVELEIERDPGLDTLAGINLPLQPDRSIFEFCKERALARMELRYTEVSRTLVKPVVGNPLALEFTTGAIDDIFPQRDSPVRSYHLQGSMRSGISVGPRSFGNDPHVRLTLELTGINTVASPQAVQADLAFGDTVWLQSGTNGVRVGATLQQVHYPQYGAGPGEIEPNRFQVVLSTSNPIGTSFNPMRVGSSNVYIDGPNVKISVQPFDLGFNGGRNQRSNSLDSNDRNKVNGGVFKWNGTQFVLQIAQAPGVEGWYGCSAMNGGSADCMDKLFLPSGTSTNAAASSEYQKVVPIEGLSYAVLNVACGNLRSFGSQPGQYPAFGGADWGTSFADQADVVWGFTEFQDASAPVTANSPVNGYNPGTLVLGATNAGPTRTTNMFHVRARMRRCEVASDATFVTGFFVCDTFEILARTAPLTIVGTVIANKLIVNPGALLAGVTWSSIYHPQSVYELRRIGILHGLTAAQTIAGCDSNPNEPIWLPTISLAQSYNYYTCSASSLRDKADPFRWTTVDPDCGLPTSPAASTAYKCKGRVMRLNVKELSRRSVL